MIFADTYYSENLEDEVEIWYDITDYDPSVGLDYEFEFEALDSEGKDRHVTSRAMKNMPSQKSSGNTSEKASANTTTFEVVRTFYGRQKGRGEVRVAEGTAYRCKACQTVLLTTLQRDHHRCQAKTSSAL